MVGDLYNDLIAEDFSINEISQFLKAYDEGIYLTKDIRDIDVIRKIREMCPKGKFTNKQQKVIINGILNNVDVTKYAKSDYSADVMKTIYSSLKSGIDITRFKGFETRPQTVKLGLINGLDDKQIQFLIDVKYHDIDDIRYCLEDGISIKEIQSAIKKQQSLTKLRKKYSESNK